MASDYRQVSDGRPDGVILGQADDKVGIYGKVPVVRRPYNSAVHETSAVVTSSSFGASQVAVLQEVQNTLIGLGIWATA